MSDDIEKLAREHGRAAIQVLAEIMTDAAVPAKVRLAAAKALLERAWGKVTAKPAKEESRVQPITHITRTLVDPKPRPERNGFHKNKEPAFCNAGST